jgi:hypothetical protein
MISRIHSQNVHKNKAWTLHLLETLKTDTDIIMIQEPPRYQVKRIPSGTGPLGTIEYDTAHHPSWSKIFFHTNVSVYVNINVLKTHNFFLFPTFNNNIIAFTLQLETSGQSHHFVNVYNDPNQQTLKRLLTFLEHEDLENLVVLGDVTVAPITLLVCVSSILYHHHARCISFISIMDS